MSFMELADVYFNNYFNHMTQVHIASGHILIHVFLLPYFSSTSIPHLHANLSIIPQAICITSGMMSWTWNTGSFQGIPKSECFMGRNTHQSGSGNHPTLIVFDITFISWGNLVSCLNDGIFRWMAGFCFAGATDHQSPKDLQNSGELAIPPTAFHQQHFRQVLRSQKSCPKEPLMTASRLWSSQGVEKGTGRRNTDNAGIIRLWSCLKWKKEQTCCQGRAWREWAPFSWRSGERSWHDFAAAKDQSPRTTTQHVLRCRFQSQDLLVSQWHSLPQGTGTFPTAYLGANSLCVRCVAMLPLPSKLSNYKMRDLPAQNIDKSDDSQ